jgi:hypothetical protein
MNESENVSMDDDMESVWNHIDENPLLLGIELSDTKGLDLLSALKDIYETNKTNQEGAQLLLTLLANVLVAASQGDGEQVVEEVIVQDAMAQFEQEARKILDEGR